MKRVNTTYNSTTDLINKLQELKGKTKLKIYKNIGNFYDIMNIRMDVDTFARNAQGISKIHLEVLMLKRFLQTKPKLKIMDMNFYDFYYTVIKKRKEEEQKENIDDQYETEYMGFKYF